MSELPIPDEVNPNHPVLKAAREHWHKIAAFIMWKLKTKRLVITLADIDAMSKLDLVIVLHEHSDSVEVKLLSREEGEALAREHRGMPV
jgi:L-ascorbate metabolism protein UlaG (beta-lactamase superfamily)